VADNIVMTSYACK